jgi:hypothetical protein
MRIFNDTIIDNEVTASGVTSDPINLNHIAVMGIQADWTATSGTIAFQVSNDEGTDNAGSGVSTWSTIASPTLSPDGTGNGVMSLSDIPYRWGRVLVTTSGSGNITVKSNGKGF